MGNCSSSPSSSEIPQTHGGVSHGEGSYLGVPLLHDCEHGLSNSPDTKYGVVVGRHCPEPQQGASFLRTCFNGFNALSGVGILSIPYALSEGGWLSLVLLLALAAICCYTGLLLQRCMDAGSHIETYPDIGEFAFGYRGRLAVSFFMYLELYLVAVGFLILEGDNLGKLLPGTSVEVGGIRIEGKQLFTLVSALVILPTTWLRSLGALAYVSVGGVVASVVVVGCVFWAGAFDHVGFHQRGQVVNFSGLPNALGLYAFCFCGHAVFPTLCTSMKDKKQFPKVLLVCFALCTLNYGSIAVIGYLMYGGDLKSQITLNLPVGNLNTKIAIITTLINPFTKYALLVTPVATAIEQQLSFKNKIPLSFFTRTSLVISTVVIALTVPLFGLLMSLIGSFLSVIASMLLPCICYIKIFDATRRSKLESIIIMGIMAMGTVIGVMGTYSSLQQIVNNI
uniref:Vacuolar amino acid transporter 1 n=1 Tax=Anthurium amnicola TaxID=1678845 RepID=A0A1D1YKC7_9ARAE